MRFSVLRGGFRDENKDFWDNYGDGREKEREKGQRRRLSLPLNPSILLSLNPAQISLSTLLEVRLQTLKIFLIQIPHKTIFISLNFTSKLKIAIKLVNPSRDLCLLLLLQA